jgi:hypothetical protein
MMIDNGDRIKAVLAAVGQNFCHIINWVTVLLNLVINVMLGLTSATGTKPSRSRSTD